MTEHLFDTGSLTSFESQPCNFTVVPSKRSIGSVAGLFAGIGGIELGLAAAGFDTEILCEWWTPAQSVLRSRFPDVPVVGDIRDLRSLPKVEIVSGGFPCQDLSQAGRTAGISGEQSGLVGEVFRLLRRRHPKWLVLENVQFMLQLDGGRGMRYLIDSLEEMKYRWAYRVVDSRFSGVPQRRRRVVLVASRTEDPRTVLFADDAGEPTGERYRDDAFGFFWTEGLRGLGWAIDAVPTLKGGSTIGIPSPPAVWVPSAEVGRKLITPRIEDAEEMQGFKRGWTSSIEGKRSAGTRWKLVGNAVTTGVSSWLGERLASPGNSIAPEVVLGPGAPWPSAAHGAKGRVFKVAVSEYPLQRNYRHLLDVIDVDASPSLSRRGASGFFDRTKRGSLRFNPLFLADVADHIDLASEQLLLLPA